MLARHQPREYIDATTPHGEIVIAAAIGLAAILDHPQAAALGAIGRRQFLEPDHAMGNRVDGLVIGVAGQVVEQQHRGAIAGEIMLEQQDLPAIAQRTLRQQPDFRQAVEHDAVGLHTLHRLEHSLGGLAQLQVRRIEQRLLLLGIEQAFGRRQFEDLELLVYFPIMRIGRQPQLGFGFRQRHVEAFLAARMAFEQKLQRHRGLTGARTPLEQVEMPASQTTHEDIV